jgi:hypothetical protein
MTDPSETTLSNVALTIEPSGVRVRAGGREIEGYTDDTFVDFSAAAPGIVKRFEQVQSKVFALRIDIDSGPIQRAALAFRGLSDALAGPRMDSRKRPRRIQKKIDRRGGRRHYISALWGGS